MDKLTENLLKAISDYTEGGYTGAYNIRENAGCGGRQSTENIEIDASSMDEGTSYKLFIIDNGNKFSPAGRDIAVDLK